MTAVTNVTNVVAPSPGAQIETITPERAVQLLENNPTNRRIRQTRVNLYAQAMARGEWVITGETIKIGVNKLVDGQHRLWACIEAGVPFQTYVVYGVEDAVMAYVDSGLPRSMADVNELHGYDYTTQRAALARVILGWENDVLTNTNKWNLVATRGETLRVVQDNYEAMTHALHMAFRIRSTVGGNVTTMAAMIMAISEANPVKADEFIEKWLTGDMLGTDDPVRALRHWTTSRTIQKRRTEPQEYLAAMVKAWNAFVQDQPIRKMIIKQKETIAAVIPGPITDPLPQPAPSISATAGERSAFEPPAD